MRIDEPNPFHETCSRVRGSRVRPAAHCKYARVCRALFCLLARALRAGRPTGRIVRAAASRCLRYSPPASLPLPSHLCVPSPSPLPISVSALTLLCLVSVSSLSHLCRSLCLFSLCLTLSLSLSLTQYLSVCLSLCRYPPPLRLSLCLCVPASVSLLPVPSSRRLRASVVFVFVAFAAAAGRVFSEACRDTTVSPGAAPRGACCCSLESPPSLPCRSSVAPLPLLCRFSAVSLSFPALPFRHSS